MARTDEEQSSEVLPAHEEIAFSTLAATLTDLADQLQAVARRADAKDIKRDLAAVERQDIDDEEVHQEINDRITETFVNTLNGLRQFRRNYEYWERAITEHVLANRGVSQREAARHLGVAASTINRWAQHPLKSTDQESDR